ncbi:hypothetical protein NEOLEDRAFT_1145646 [Neolentinus lepideus HHB14362 ss-1]|uniref:Uncharacterized protein n=1 Tax=Neolentinus lepideus HHB14362 ss-1 TaxID=1314782 RepID=A0A165UYV1_9AGAM|nr:hypothetical protein NEOLEDRAFT_1145646 [Neolentinus lepideus HHB14362 ss-1]
MMVEDTAMHGVIYQGPLPGRSQQQFVDLATSATPERYRLVDCKAFLDEHTLRIEEFSTITDVKYSTISYVWKGLSAQPGVPDGWLFQEKVVGIRSALMSFAMLAVLRCTAVYSGVQRLIRLDEETTWIHRGWTLQEVLAPPTVLVLVAWRLGSGQGRAGDGRIGVVEEVIPGESAMISMALVLEACTVGTLSFTSPRKEIGGPLMVKATVFSDIENHSYNDPPFWQPQRKVLAPNVAALAVAMDLEGVRDTDEKNFAIWQSSLMRTSSRPVDMVFSIMGLFGVTLDTSAFKRNDRLGATIALAREILRKGGKAWWLGTSFQIEPCRHLSTFATFPATNVRGKALVQTKGGPRQVSQLVTSEYPCAEVLCLLPQGSMDEDGYFSFVGKAIPVTRAVRDDTTDTAADVIPARPSVIKAMDGSCWIVIDDHPLECSTGQEPLASQNGVEGIRAFIALLSWFNEYYPGATPANDTNNVKTMVLEEHNADAHRYHLRAYACLSRRTMGWVKTWKEYPLVVGGPEDLATWPMDDAAHPLDEVALPEPRYPFPTSARKDVTLKDQTIRKSRWAVDQGVLENHLVGHRH